MADISFYWDTFTDEQRDDIYNTASELHTFNESYEDIESGESPRVVLVKPTKRKGTR